MSWTPRPSSNEKPRNPLSDGAGERTVRRALNIDLGLRINGPYIITDKETGEQRSVDFLILNGNIPVEVQSDYHDEDSDAEKKAWLEKQGFKPLITVHERVVQTKKGYREFKKAVQLVLGQVQNF